MEGVDGRESSPFDLVFMGEHGLEIGVMKAEGALIGLGKVEEFTGDFVVDMPDGAVVLEGHSGLQEGSQVREELGAIAADKFGG